MKFYRRLYGGGHKFAPFPPPPPTTIQTSVKFRDFAELTILLILKRSFQCCRQIFPDLLNSWKGLFRTDKQIKFNVHMFFKDYFVSNVIKFSFQVIKIAFKGPVTYLLKPLLGKNFGGVAWTPFVISTWQAKSFFDGMDQRALEISKQCLFLFSTFRPVMFSCCFFCCFRFVLVFFQLCQFV